MNKKDIYEHLANIYLDASVKRKKNTRKYSRLFKAIMFIPLSLIVVFSVTLLLKFTFSKKHLNSQLALVLNHDAVKVNFHFDPAKKEIFSIDLKGLNLSKYKSLEFTAKQAQKEVAGSLRIEFVNSFNEKSYVYVSGIPLRWKYYRLNFSDFKDMRDWSTMKSLAFIVEEWNTREKNGAMYIDDVKVLK